ANLGLNSALSGTASNGVDYFALPGSITIPAGQSFAVLPIVAINDLFVQGNRTVILTISTAPTYNIGGSPSATVFIVDDDLPQVTITATGAMASVIGLPPFFNPINGSFTISRAGSLDRDLLVN